MSNNLAIRLCAIPCFIGLHTWPYPCIGFVDTSCLVLGMKRPLIASCVQCAMTPQNKAKRLLIACVLSTHNHYHYHELSFPLLSMLACQAIVSHGMLEEQWRGVDAWVQSAIDACHAGHKMPFFVVKRKFDETLQLLSMNSSSCSATPTVLRLFDFPGVFR